MSRYSGSVGNLLSVTASFLSIPSNKTILYIAPNSAKLATEYIERLFNVSVPSMEFNLPMLMLIQWHHLLLILMFIRPLGMMVTQPNLLEFSLHGEAYLSILKKIQAVYKHHGAVTIDTT